MGARRRGFTLVEGLIASLVLVLVLTGLFAHWTGMFRRYLRAREVSAAAQIARAEVERAKVFGVANMPLGTYASASGTASWTGAFDGTAWTSGATAYFDALGGRLASGTGARFKLQVTLADSGLLTKTGGYGFSLESKRAMSVAVSLVPDNTVLFRAGTELVMGGL